MNDWQAGLTQVHAQGCAYSIVTIIGVEGSAPRDAGSKMVVSHDRIYGSIGGGSLEFNCVQKARDLLAQTDNQQIIDYYPLSAKFNQCCSGAVSVMFESFVEIAHKIVIFGAGHVAKELASILPKLDCDVSLIDQRPEQLAQFDDQRLNLIHSQQPVHELEKLSHDSYVLIMTHDHQLDYELCYRALSDCDFAFIGLIGSKAKATKFKQRLANHNIDMTRLSKLVSPIGLQSVPGKKPMEVAVSVAAQLQTLFYMATEIEKRTEKKAQGVRLKETLKLKSFLSHKP